MMIKRIKVYLLVVWYGVKSKLNYRTSSILELTGMVLEISVQIYIWKFLIENSDQYGTTLSQMVTYILLVRLASILTSSTIARVLSNRIRDGAIATDFVSPISMKGRWLCADLGNNLFRVLVVLVPIAMICAILWGIQPPASVAHGVGSIVSLFLGCMLAFEYSYILGLISFWLLRNPFYKWHFRNIEQIFAGTYFPLWFYPEWLEKITRCLPFRYFSYEATAVYLGKVSEPQIREVILMQILWIAVLLIVESIVWYGARRKVIVQGG